MSDTDASVPWTYGGNDVEIDQTQNIKSDSPLQYAALYAESQPNDGKVSVNKLNIILARARIPNDKSARILELCSDPAAQEVTEHDFYWAMTQISSLQADPTHEIVYTDSDSITDLPMNELKLYDIDTTANGETADDVADWEVPDYNPTAEHTLRVSLLTSNAGSFFMKHAVYSVDGSFGEKSVKVLRRYRDFASLYSLLVRKYPFRALPVLPPKRLSMNGKYLVGDSQEAFLSRRAAGLQRFINLLVQHPIVSKDQLVDAFLFADTQFDPHTFSAKFQTDELSGKVASPLFISQWSQSRLDEWSAIETAVREFSNQITSLCVIMDKQIRRLESAELDSEVMGRSTVTLSRFVTSVYPYRQDDLTGIQERLDAVSRYSDSRQEQLRSEADMIRDGPLTELKLYRDMLSGILDLFTRIETHGGNTIPDQQKQIATAQKKLVSLSTREDVKEDDLHKLRMRIQQAQASIRDQTNRGWLIKMVVSQELEMVQATQYQISKILRSLSRYLSQATTKSADLASQLNDSLSSAPLNI